MKTQRTRHFVTGFKQGVHLSSMYAGIIVGSSVMAAVTRVTVVRIRG